MDITVHKLNRLYGCQVTKNSKHIYNTVVTITTGYVIMSFVIYNYINVLCNIETAIFEALWMLHSMN